MIQLSPAARRGIFHNLIAREGHQDYAEIKRDRDLDRVEEVIMYRCTVCDELHDDEDDAAECCAPAGEVEGLHDEEAPSRCPVCAEKYRSPHEAVDCCLWKDIDAPTRWRMADQVEAGATWIDVLGDCGHG